jgi:flagellar hook assembly protein FlgD
VTRLPAAAFVALVVATIAAFFVTQHLKVTTPLVAGHPTPFPGAINPVDGHTCRVRSPRGQLERVSFQRMKVSFYLLHRADEVSVYVVKPGGGFVKTFRPRQMSVKRRSVFVWDGREDNGSVAPDGIYYLRVSLIHQGRSLLISNSSGAAEPVTVVSRPPRLVVTGVSQTLIPQKLGAAVTIRYRGNDGLRPRVLIYRTDLPGGLRLVKSYAATAASGQTQWNGTVSGGLPAPQGTYLVGLELTDKACTTGYFPASKPPAPGSTEHAGVTVRYLAAQPPLVPVRAGTRATVFVDSLQQAYGWTLRRAGGGGAAGTGTGTGTGRVLDSGTSSAYTLSVPMPAGGPGLYELSLRSGTHRTTVPLIASAPPAGRAPVLVVVAALTRQGLNPSDDDGDGLPNTLQAGDPVRLERPLADGLPAGLGDEAALLAYLRKAGLRFDLTTDLGLLGGVGPQLKGHAGVVLAGSERWLPDSLGSALSTYVEQGGHVLSLGIDSLRRGVTISAGRALDPTGPRTTDALLARPAGVVSGAGTLILVDKDGLHIFSGTSNALRGYRSYEPIPSVAAPAVIASAAGASNAQPSIIGYRLGHGIVIDIGLPGFGSSLAHNFDAQQLLGRIWSVLSR